MDILTGLIIGLLTLGVTIIGTILTVSSRQEKRLGERIDAGDQNTEKLINITNQRITDAEKNTEKQIESSKQHTKKLIDITNQRITDAEKNTEKQIESSKQHTEKLIDIANQRITDAEKNTEKLIENSKPHTERVQQHTAVLLEILTQLVNSNSQNIDETNQRISRLANDVQEVHATLFADGIIGKADTIQESEK